MEPLNYCRQILQDMPDAPPKLRNDTLYGDAARLLVKALARSSQKFMLPMNGKMLDDKDLKALPDDEVLRLPFNTIALEVPIAERDIGDDLRVGKCVVFASEVPDWQRIGLPCASLAIVSAHYFKSENGAGWLPTARFWMPAVSYIDRDRRSPEGLPAVKLYVSEDAERIGMKRIMAVAHCVLGFLNALACVNVTTETIAPRKPPKKSADALPFDSYHVLVLRNQGERGTGSGGRDHRSPREHVRRGHIRRLQSGARIWVNACVVARGAPGRVDKDYAMPAHGVA